VETGFDSNFKQTPLSAPSLRGGNVQRLSLRNPVADFVEPSGTAKPNQFFTEVVFRTFTHVVEGDKP
jgi:hypothetical protein